MPKVIAELKSLFEQRKFKDMPIGPIGMYVDPIEFKWALAIEKCLGGLMSSFICSNYEDERLLQQVLARNIRAVYRRPRVIVTDFNVQLYDVSNNRPVTNKYPTVLDMLSIKKAVVANTLIDQRRIETILLLPDRRAGSEVIEHKSIQNCHEAFLMNGDQYMGQPTFRMYSCQDTAPQFYHENTQHVIQSRKAEIEQLKRVAGDIQNEINSLNDKVKKNQLLKSQHEKQLSIIQRDKISENYKLRAAQDIRLPDQVDRYIYEEEIEALTKTIDEMNQQLEILNEKMIPAKEKFESYFKERQKAEAEMNEIGEQAKNLEKEHQDFSGGKDEYTQKIKYYKDYLNKFQLEHDQLEEKIRIGETELEVITNFKNDILFYLYIFKIFQNFLRN
jgi:structural maintenance of chromosomes protein 6